MKIPSFKDLQSGTKAALAQALSVIETDPYEPATVNLLSEAWRAPRAHVLGITGPPGVGKSTLTSVLIAKFRERGQTVGVIAVDPSSKTSGGALLGDRTRIITDPDDEGVFVRSMAARDQLGGLAFLARSAITLMRALFDVVIVETVGVGQSETDISDHADTVIFCVQPGSGDSLQFMKAGIMEVPHIAVVTKADLGKAATRARTDLQGAIGLAVGQTQDWTVPVLAVSSQMYTSIEDLLEAIAGHWTWLQDHGRLTQTRQAQGQAWLTRAVLDRFGREGLKRLGSDLTLASGESPFEREAELSQRLKP